MSQEIPIPIPAWSENSEVHWTVCQVWMAWVWLFPKTYDLPEHTTCPVKCENVSFPIIRLYGTSKATLSTRVRVPLLTNFSGISFCLNINLWKRNSFLLKLSLYSYHFPELMISNKINIKVTVTIMGGSSNMNYK